MHARAIMNIEVVKGSMWQVCFDDILDRCDKKERRLESLVVEESLNTLHPSRKVDMVTK